MQYHIQDIKVKHSSIGFLQVHVDIVFVKIREYWYEAKFSNVPPTKQTINDDGYGWNQLFIELHNLIGKKGCRKYEKYVLFNRNQYDYVYLFRIDC